MRRVLALGVAFVSLLAAGFLWVRDRPVAEAQVALPPVEAEAPVVEPLPPPPKAALTDEQREARRFNRYDRDKDDRLTREEYLVNRRKAFAKADVNGDGRLGFEEFAVATVRKFGKADRDGDGALGRGEFATTAVKRRVRAAPTCKCGDEEEK